MSYYSSCYPSLSSLLLLLLLFSKFSSLTFLACLRGYVRIVHGWRRNEQKQTARRARNQNKSWGWSLALLVIYSYARYYIYIYDAFWWWWWWLVWWWRNRGEGGSITNLLLEWDGLIIRLSLDRPIPFDFEPPPLNWLSLFAFVRAIFTSSPRRSLNPIRTSWDHPTEEIHTLIIYFRLSKTSDAIYIPPFDLSNNLEKYHDDTNLRTWSNQRDT